MRRVVPWALLLLIGVGAGLGAAVGAAGSPGTAGSAALTGPAAQQWLSGVLAATKAAGTAHLVSTSVESSPNPNLRGSSAGSGVVDFATGGFQVSETDRSVEWSSENGGPTQAEPETSTHGEIVIGRSDYENFGPPGFPDNWTKQSIPRDEGELGLGTADGAGGLVSALIGPFSEVTIRTLGTSAVNGVSTTRYLVQTQTEPSTAPSCPVSTRKRPKALLGRAVVWVDQQGRLAQVRVNTSLSRNVLASVARSLPSIADQPLGPITITSTLRFARFGAPVHIARPALGNHHAFSTSVIGSGSAVYCG